MDTQATTSNLRKNPNGGTIYAVVGPENSDYARWKLGRRTNYRRRLPPWLRQASASGRNIFPNEFDNPFKLLG
jgi:hypothetical protein